MREEIWEYINSEYSGFWNLLNEGGPITADTPIENIAAGSVFQDGDLTYLILYGMFGAEYPYSFYPELRTMGEVVDDIIERAVPPNFHKED